MGREDDAILIGSPYHLLVLNNHRIAVIRKFFSFMRHVKNFRLRMISVIL